MTTPCDLCPFRNDGKRLYVHPSVLLDMAAGQFCCHKTGEVYEDDEISEIRPTKDSQHCAGALIFCEKTGQPHQMMRIAERLGMYDRRKLDMNAPVFSSSREVRRLSPKRSTRLR
jgi:hypothetical protein